VTSYKELTDIADQLREGVSVIINLNLIQDSKFYRCTDFLSGVTYAIDGRIEKVAGKDAKIYLITPKNIMITKEYKDTISSLQVSSL